jgi:D-glycero-D-manno-heptose 1,7-bisphosphate phosphatase
MSKYSAASSAKIRVVFLDREGVLSRKPPEGQYVADWADFQPLPGMEEAIARLNQAGLTVILVTNQRGVALGRYTGQDVAGLHDQLRGHLGSRGARLDAIYVCSHDVGQCSCRKPQTGLFEQAFVDFPEASPDTSVMVGDSLSDIEAGTRMGMPTVLLAGDPDKQKPEDSRAAAMATETAASLLEWVNRLLGQRAADAIG